MKKNAKRHDSQRGSSTERGYGYKWQQAREGYLKRHPLCVMCKRRGLVVEASVVDHITPHKGDMALFWDSSNWQALCRLCHDAHKKRLELGGTLPGCDTDGMPVDPLHHWNK